MVACHRQAGAGGPGQPGTPGTVTEGPRPGARGLNLKLVLYKGPSKYFVNRVIGTEKQQALAAS